MDLTPYLEALRRDLAATAAPGGADVERAADLLAGSLEASVRLCLLEALSDAAAEITTQLPATSVEVRLRGRQADLVVTDAGGPPPPPVPPRPPPQPLPPIRDTPAVARLTPRLPQPLPPALEPA